MEIALIIIVIVLIFTIFLSKYAISSERNYGLIRGLLFATLDTLETSQQKDNLVIFIMNQYKVDKAKIDSYSEKDVCMYFYDRLEYFDNKLK
jgi:hypothetical protein